MKRILLSLLISSLLMPAGSVSNAETIVGENPLETEMSDTIFQLKLLQQK